MKIGMHQTFYDINLTIKYCYSDVHHCLPFGISHNHLSDCWAKFQIDLNCVCAILLFLLSIPISWIGTIVRVVTKFYCIWPHHRYNVIGSIEIYNEIYYDDKLKAITSFRWGSVVTLALIHLPSSAILYQFCEKKKREEK